MARDADELGEREEKTDCMPTPQLRIFSRSDAKAADTLKQVKIALVPSHYLKYDAIFRYFQSCSVASANSPADRAATATSGLVDYEDGAFILCRLLSSIGAKSIKLNALSS
jgi:hypothetical protein